MPLPPLTRTPAADAVQLARARSLHFAGRLLGFALLLLLPLLLAMALDQQRDAEHARHEATEQVRLLALSVARDGDEALLRSERLLDFLATRQEVRALDGRRCTALLAGQLKIDPLFANAGVFDRQGRMVCSSKEIPEGFDRSIHGQTPSVRAEFEAALRSEGVRIGNPVMSSLVGRLILPVTQVIRGEDGQTIGLALVSLDLMTLAHSWQRFGLPEGSVLVLHNPAGVIVARLPEPAQWIGTDAAAKVASFKAMHPAGHGSDVGLDGIERIYSMVAMPAHGWLAVAGLPASVVYAEPQQREREALAWAGAALGLALLLAYGLSRHLAAPLRNLERSASAVADGRRDVRAREDVPGEFHTVACEFNRMLDQLGHAEQQARRMSGMYDALARSNRALVRSKDKRQLCAEVCAACVDAGHAMLASYWQLEDGKLLRLTASAGPVLGMYGSTEVSLDLDDAEIAATPTGQAIFSGLPMVANDYQNDPRATRWHERARLHGVKALAALPLQRHGRTEGLLMLHVNQADWFDATLLQLLGELVADLAFGFDLIERDAQRAETERQLVHSRERFQRLFQAAPLPLAVFGYPDERLLDANPAYVEELKLPLEQMRGHTLKELGLGPSDADSQRLHQRLREQRGRLRGFEVGFRMPDGRTHEVQINAEQVEFDGRSALLTVNADLTLRKRNEDALRESLARFELAASTGHVWAWRPDTGLKPPTALLALLGYGADELSHQPGLWLPEVYEQDRQPLLEALRRHLRERVPLTAEFRMRGRDGRLHWLQASGQAQWDEAGRVLQMAGIVVDVSERHRMEHTLATREEQLSGIIETAMDAIITVDAAQRIVVFNKAAGLMFRIDAQAALGEPLSRFIPAALRETHEAHVRRFASSGRSARRMGEGHALTGLRSDGEQFPIEASISLLRQGDSVLMTAVVRDVSTARDAETARAAQVAAEAANRAKSQLVSRVAHELRNPLNAVLGFIQLLETDPHEPLSPAQRQHVRQSRQAGWHLARMIDDLLDSARADAGELRIEMRPVALAGLLDQALAVCGEQARRAGVQLLPAPAGASPWVMADARRLLQVLINLLSNAIKYNRSGGRVELRVAQDDAGVHCEVIDTGLGMSAEQLEHLFEPFNRLGREHSGIEGTGIGLVLVRQLLDAMGGSLQLHSVHGEGTRVRITLQPARADAAAAAITAATAEPVARSGTDASPAREGSDMAAAPPEGSLLYVEDDEVNRLLVEAYLQRWPQLRLRMAGDGAEGLAQAAQEPPDLLLLDMHLPDMDGIEFLRRLRATPQGRALTVVALSANALAEDIAAARAAGAADYWTKPLDMTAFGTRLQQLLAR